MNINVNFTKYGRYKKPIYRISIKKFKSKRNGRILKNIGTYNPLKNNKKITINIDHLSTWLINNLSLKKKKFLKHLIPIIHKYNINEKNQ